MSDTEEKRGEDLRSCLARRPVYLRAKEDRQNSLGDGRLLGDTGLNQAWKGAG